MTSTVPGDARAAALSPQRRALLAKLARQRATAPAAPPAPMRRLPHPERPDAYAVSAAQLRLLLAQRLDPASGARFHTSFGLRLTGPLERAALDAAVADLVARHESLRTVFADVDETPHQVVGDGHDVVVAHVDLRGHPAAEREQAALAAAATATAAPFDLAAGPLVRFVLYRLAEHEHALLAVAHHVVLDGWSVAIAIDELAAGYRRRLEGGTPPPPLTVQVADHAGTQRQRLAGDRAEEDLAFWTGALTDRPPADLPFVAAVPDGPRRGGKASRTIPAALVDALAPDDAATPFTTLLTALQALLVRYTGEPDLTVGTVVAGRHHTALEPVVGNFLNVLALRTELDPDGGFRAARERVRATAVAAFARPDTPLEHVVNRLGAGRAHRLFQVAFNLRNFAAARRDWGGLRVAAWEHEIDDVVYDLAVVATPGPDGYELTLQYRADLVSTVDAEAFLAHLHRLLESAAADPDRSLSTLDLVPAGHGEHLRRWSNGPAAAPATTVPRLLAARIAVAPGATAVRAGDGTLDYAALGARADRFAAALHAAGVRPGDVVAVGLGRTADLPAALLGAWRAGAAYLPLDPDHPAERLAWLLADSGARVLLTDTAHRDRYPADARVVLVDGPLPDGPLPDRSTRDGDVAYVIYTSGSTGRPKGVAVPHGALAVRVAWMIDGYGITAADRVLQFASPGFDTHAEELWPALAAGAAVTLPDGARGELTDFLPTPAGQALTVLDLPTPYWHELVGALDRVAWPAALRLVILGADAVTAPAVRAWREHFGDRVRLVNSYGPTEATIIATTAELGAADTAGSPPIGRPIAGTSAYVLDAARQPVPMGVPGELYLGGAGLAHGYLGRPALTAERFLPDPYATGPGARMYATGDRVRLRGDGQLEFLGRADTQVKIRGYRVELGEVEARLTGHPAVSQAVVVVRDARLVAYVVLRTGAVALPAQLRAHVAAALPGYLVPAAVAVLDRLPLTANGKLDRRALPAPPSQQPHEAAAPLRTPTEELVAGVFAEVLDTPAGSADADFFDLGGHSLLAVRAVARLGAAVRRDIPLRALFAAPTVAGLARTVDALLTGAGDGSADGSAVPDAEPDLVAGPDTGELSAAQQRLWLLDLLEQDVTAPHRTSGGGHSAAYVITVARRLHGPVRHDLLQDATTAVVRRHAPLRERFVTVDGEVRRAPAGTPVRVRYVDHAGTHDPVAAATAEVDACAGTPFDLGAGPLLRVGLVRIGTDEHVLYLGLHHAVADGWSVDVLLGELGGAYTALAAGAEPAFDPLPVSFADHVRWEQARADGAAGQRDLAYWTGALAGAADLDLPTDRPRPAAQTFHGAVRTRLLPTPLVEAVRQLARRHRVTPYMVLLAAFQVLLGRHAGQDDVCVGSPVAGRHRVELEPLVGYFANTVVLRGDLSGDPTFAQLLERTRAVALDAYAHQRVPFERLLGALRPARDLSRTPLFQVLFVLHDDGGGGQRLALPGVRVAPFERGTVRAARFDLTLDLWPTADGLSAAFEYNTDLFDAATVDRLAGHLHHLLTAAVDAPGTPLRALSMMDGAEHDELVRVRNDTARPVPARTVAALIDERIAARADDPALLTGDAVLSYGDLGARVERLAGVLHAHGLSRGDVVAVALPRTADLVVTLLAAWRLGTAYLPLDPQYPPGRLAYMLADSGARLLVTDRVHSGLLPAGTPAVLVDELPPPADGPPPTPAARPGDLAYVIYTSGSTGRPKGVLIEHRAFGVFLAALRERLGAGPGDTWLAQTSLSFDISTLELFLPLATGARVVLAGDHAGRDGAQLLALVRRHGVTHVQATPSGWRLLLGAGFDEPGVVALVGGEALPLPLAREVRSRTARLLNVYGPTETTVWSTSWDVPGQPARVSIGGPIANTAVYVLDDRLRPVPLGVPGELYIGGDALARGYHDRPALTAERFPPDPFRGGGARMYATGDRVRWQGDGTLEFIGRVDQQVKVRGHRIEPGEIEAALLTHPAVTVAAVVLRPDAAGEPDLVGYAVADGPLTPADLRAHLTAMLPAHLVPARYVLLDRLPLTPNGKLDRAALPAPDAAAEPDRVPPAGPAQQLVARVWAEVLGRPVGTVGAADDFFDLGGHSLLAARVAARLSAATGADVPVRLLFTEPTVRRLAAALPAPAPAAAEPGPEPDTDDPRLSSGEERLWFMDQFAPDNAAYTIATGLRLRGPLDPALLGRVLDELAQRHATLRTRYPVRDDGTPAVVVEPTGAVPLSTVDVSGLPPAERDAAARALLTDAAAVPFDLATGPPVRALLVRLDTDAHVLLLAVHHIATDGWSTDILVGELHTLYSAYAQGRPSPLPVLTARYRDYAAWQRTRLAGPALREDVEYWRGALAGIPPIELPTDRPCPPEQTFAGAVHGFTVGPAVTEALHRLARAHGATLYMVLLAAWQSVLWRTTGQPDFGVGTPVAGRSQARWEPLVGLFVNMLTMRADLTGDPTFAQLLRRTRSTALAAYGRAEVPFEHLVKELDVVRDVRRSPLFQVVFALQNHTAAGAGAAAAGPLAATPFHGEARATRFDLGLYVTEGGAGLAGALAYNTDLFDERTAVRLSGQLTTLLRAVTADPHVPVGALELMDPAERAAVLAGGVDRSAVAVPAGGLHDVIAPHVRDTPDAPAIVDGATTLTYAQLDRRVERLAGVLRGRGVGRDTPVGICLRPRAEVAVAVLAVLRAGGAYLPLDPEQPPARLAALLTDAGAALVLTEAATVDRVAGAAVATLDVDQPGTDETTGLSTVDLPPVHPAQLAYVIYTSGSTGQPKGVGVAHREALHYLAGVRDRFGVAPGGSYALTQSLSFDFAITVFYLALSTGGSLHLLPKRIGGAELAGYLREHRIGHLKLTPSHLAALATEVDDVAELLPRELLILGGEASKLAWARQLAAAGTCAVVNHYGPTETTVGVTTFRVAPSTSDGDPVLTPIGRPLPFARVYVLDARLRPVPPGLPGEVYLGGDRLARGYLGRPAMTADRFLPDPFRGGGTRMYRTGDRGRWLPGGDLEYLGRTDQQVKIRGYRVELGEVDSALAGLPGVAQAVATAPGPPGGQQLVGYLVAEPGSEPLSVPRLRALLAEQYPDHLIPGRFVWLDELPLQAHGKVDRARLPEPARDRADAGGYVAPAPGVEALVAEVFGAVLDLPAVGAADDFFALGGHSLLAIQVVAQLRRRLPADVRPVSAMDLFKHPTPAGLAALVSTVDAGPRPLLHELSRPLPPGRTPVASLVCTPYGGASAIVFQPLADALPDGHRLFSVAVPGHDIGLAEEAQPLAEVARRCVAEILQNVPGPVILYGHCGPGGALAAEIARQLEQAGGDLRAVYLGGVFPFARPTGRITGPLARFSGMDRLRNDRVHANWLRGMGADLEGLDETQIRFLVRTMRADARLAEEYFTGLLDAGTTPIAAPIVSVVGERDPSTEFYTERFAEWGFLTTGGTAAVVLDEAGHYFLKYRSAELAEIVTGTPPVGAPPPPRAPDATWWVQATRPPRPATEDAEPIGPAGPQPGMGRFLAVAASQLVSMTGSALTEFALPIWIYLQTGSLLQFTLFTVIGVAPGLLVAPFAGALVDRYDRRRVMLAADITALGTQGALGMLAWSGTLGVHHVYLLLAVLSVALSFQRVAYAAAVPQLVPKRYLGHANGVVQMFTGAGQLVVPLFAVGLLAGVGLPGILLLDVLSYAVAVVLILAIRFPDTLGHRRRESVREELTGGWRMSLGRPGLRAMVLFFAAFNLCFAPLFNLIPPLVLGFGTLGQVAQVSTAAAAGILGGGLLMTMWGGPSRHRMGVMLLATAVLGVACALPALRPSVPLVAAGAFAMSFLLAVINGIYATIVQVKVPQRYHGRVFALNMMVAWSTLPIGLAVVAPLGTRFLEPLMAPGGALAGTVGAVIGVGPGRGVALLYLVLAAAIVLIALVCTRVRGLAAFDTTVPDAEPDDVVGLRAIRRGGTP